MYSRSPSKKSLHIGKYKEENTKLPTNWERRISNNIFPNRPYYFNWITNESKWDFPESTIFRQTPPKIRRHNSRDSYLRGGKQLTNILYHFDKDDFVRWYTYKKDDLNENAYEIYEDLLRYRTNLDSFQVTESPLSILVGATNIHSGDYDRFKDSNLYNLYICEEDSTNIKRQYYMYTIGYQNIFSNMGLYLVGRVSRIHFDISTAYSCPIEYLRLAENILIAGGTIVFDLAQHLNILYDFNKELNIFDSGQITKEEIENRHNVVIDVEQELITPRITDGRYGSGHLAPQISATIIDQKTNQQFKKDLYRGYIDYCRQRYPRLRFEQKTYSFSNYTYPVPIKTINQELHIDSYNNIFNFIANNVMTLAERIDYIKYKRLSYHKMHELIDRVAYTPQLFREYGLTTHFDIEKSIFFELTKEFEYIEGTKI